MIRKALAAIILVIIITSCFPSEDKIIERCEEAALSAMQESWEACTDFYEREILPSLYILIKDLKNYIADQCQQNDPAPNKRPHIIIDEKLPLPNE